MINNEHYYFKILRGPFAVKKYLNVKLELVVQTENQSQKNKFSALENKKNVAIIHRIRAYVGGKTSRGKIS